MNYLTKTLYLTGLQCPRILWKKIHEKEKIPSPDIRTLAIFKNGRLVGNAAKELFPDGKNSNAFKNVQNLEKTKKLLPEKKPIFEAGALYENCYARTDILEPAENKWNLIEVKSGTKVKNINLHDVSFQKYCFENAGIPIEKCYLMHLNNEYEKNGELDYTQLFKKTEITEEVNKLLEDVPKNIENMISAIESETCPENNIGTHCKNPYECPVMECWDFLPDTNIFDLYRGGKKSFELLESGVQRISEIPEECKLNEKQQIQKKCETTGETYVNKDEIKKFIDSLEYPLHFLDFETFGMPIPMFDKQRPYQQIPFQFSLHIIENEGEEPTHVSFLYNGSGDPRKEFLENLTENILEKGSIITYNMSFEKRIVNELVAVYLEKKEWWEGVESRVADLIIPFNKFYYYNPEQRGSASLKKVLPAVTGKNYNNLVIGDGETASIEFVNIAYNETGEEKKQAVRNALEQYCGLDTEGMIWILDELKKIIE